MRRPTLWTSPRTGGRLSEDELSIDISVRYHNLLRRAAGTESQELSLPKDASVADALDALAAVSRPSLVSLLFTVDGSVVPYLVLFRNQKLVTHDQFGIELEDGDELQLFPAVSGG